MSAETSSRSWASRGVGDQAPDQESRRAQARTENEDEEAIVRREERHNDEARTEATGAEEESPGEEVEATRTQEGTRPTMMAGSRVRTGVG